MKIQVGSRVGASRFNVLPGLAAAALGLVIASVGCGSDVKTTTSAGGNGGSNAGAAGVGAGGTAGVGAAGAAGSAAGGTAGTGAGGTAGTGAGGTAGSAGTSMGGAFPGGTLCW